MMSMAPAKTVEAQNPKKRKHAAEMTTDKLKAIAMVTAAEGKAPSPGSLVKPVEVISLVDDLFGDLDRVFYLTCKVDAILGLCNVHVVLVV